MEDNQRTDLLNMLKNCSKR